MTGSALFDFLVACVVLCGAVYLFYCAIEGISQNAMFTKIARAAVGLAALVAFLLAIKAVLFGGGSAMTVSPIGLIYFAIGVIVVLIVLYVIKLVVPMIAPAGFVEPVLLVIGGICLIALLVLAANVMFGVGPSLGSLRSGPLLR